MVFFYVVLIFFGFIGIGLILAPEFMYEITEQIKNRNAEPTETYLNMMRVQGAFLIIISVIMIVRVF